MSYSARIRLVRRVGDGSERSMSFRPFGASWASWRTRDADAVEWLDADQMEGRDLERNLRDIRWINAALGWTT